MTLRRQDLEEVFGIKEIGTTGSNMNGCSCDYQKKVQNGDTENNRNESKGWIQQNFATNLPDLGIEITKWSRS